MTQVKRHMSAKRRQELEDMKIKAFEKKWSMLSDTHNTRETNCNKCEKYLAVAVLIAVVIIITGCIL